MFSRYHTADTNYHVCARRRAREGACFLRFRTRGQIWSIHPCSFFLTCKSVWCSRGNLPRPYVTQLNQSRLLLGLPPLLYILGPSTAGLSVLSFFFFFLWCCASQLRPTPTPTSVRPLTVYPCAQPALPSLPAMHAGRHACTNRDRRGKCLDVEEKTETEKRRCIQMSLVYTTCSVTLNLVLSLGHCHNQKKKNENLSKSDHGVLCRTEGVSARNQPKAFFFFCLARNGKS